MFKLTLSFKGRILKVCQTTDTEITIGRQPDCDLRIDNLAVSPLHARVALVDDTLVLTDISDEGDTLVNGRPLEGDTCPLSHGDTLLIGKHTIAVARDHTVADERPEEPLLGRSLAKGWLQFLNGPKLGRTIRLDRTLVRLGKAGHQSAMIANRSDGFYISHLEGDGPTLVGDRQVGEQSLRLHDGDTIQVGDIRMLFFTESL